MKSLAPWSVCASVQFDGLLAEFAVVLVDIRAAAVFLVAGDRVVVVAVDRRDAPVGDQRAHLVGVVRAVADQTAAAVDAVDAELLDAFERGLQRGQIAVDVGNHRHGTGAGIGGGGHRRSDGGAVSGRLLPAP
jgi:hypothetical protein